MGISTRVSGGSRVVGHLTTFDILQSTGEPTFIDRKRNKLMATWAGIAAQAIGLGDRGYRIQGFYIEYVNGLDPEDAWAAPEYANTDGRDYYEDLSLTADLDFLRVPLATPPALRIGTGYADYLSDPNGNSLRFFAQTQGTSGIHAKAFGAGSRVVGAALVATPTWGDRSQDLIFARTYLASDKQITVTSGHAVGMLWEVEFTVEEEV